MARNLVVALALSLALVGVSAQDSAEAPSTTSALGQIHPARLTARPGAGGTHCTPGTHLLKLGGGRTAHMRVGPGRRDARKALLVALHGTGSTSSGALWAFRAGFGTAGLVMLAPVSESRNWNLFYGSDLDSVDRALKQTFRRCRIDPRTVAVGGVSDGAGTALTLGLSNGDLVRAVIALSPWGEQTKRPVGKPRVYVAHGTRDTVIPIRVSDAIVRELRSSGYAVTYQRFAGGHDVPESISRDAVRWLLRR